MHSCSAGETLPLPIAALKRSLEWGGVDFTKDKASCVWTDVLSKEHTVRGASTKIYGTGGRTETPIETCENAQHVLVKFGKHITFH